MEATPEDDGKEAVYAEDKNEIKEDYEKISFSHSLKFKANGKTIIQQK